MSSLGTGFISKCLVLLATAIALGPTVLAQSARDHQWTLFPDTLVFKPFLADPLEARNGITFLGVDSSIPETGSARFHLEIGGTFGVAEWSLESEKRWQLAASAGFRGQFDQSHSQDNIGWNGIYGLLLLGEILPRLSLKTGLMHTSSHLGDELIERTGRQRIGYTRQEIVAALSWQARSNARLYGEIGWGINTNDKVMQEPGRLQAGVEWFFADRGRWRLYSAIDLGSFEEQNWSIDVSAQVGYAFERGSRRWRLGILAFDGRVPIGELSFHRESWVGLGVWLNP